MGAGEEAAIRLRLTAAPAKGTGQLFGQAFENALPPECVKRIPSTIPSSRPLTEDEARVMRQALAGMLWSKQYYYYDVDRWLEEHQAHPLHGDTRKIRNREWFHLMNGDIISMPDKWEYPWYAAWDLAFHTIALAMVDAEFAKEQLELMLRESYLHPNGQIPAYEWNFSDVNPPVHAWATLFLHQAELALPGTSDIVSSSARSTN